MVRTAIDVTATLWLRFRARAVAQGSNEADLIRELIRQAVEETKG